MPPGYYNKTGLPYKQGFQKGHGLINGGNKGKHWKQNYKRITKPFTEEHKRKIKENSKRGTEHYRWCNGNYQHNNQRNDSAYNYWSRKVKDRDGWKCKINNDDCRGYCIAHHILSFTKFPELGYNINNGITLCQFHHPRKRAEEQKFIPLFKDLIKI
jgi:hypothetical protein